MGPGPETRGGETVEGWTDIYYVQGYVALEKVSERSRRCVSNPLLTPEEPFSLESQLGRDNRKWVAGTGPTEDEAGDQVTLFTRRSLYSLSSQCRGFSWVSGVRTQYLP